MTAQVQTAETAIQALSVMLPAVLVVSFCVSSFFRMRRFFGLSSCFLVFLRDVCREFYPLDHLISSGEHVILNLAPTVCLQY